MTGARSKVFPVELGKEDKEGWVWVYFLLVAHACHSELCLFES